MVVAGVRAWRVGKIGERSQKVQTPRNKINKSWVVMHSVMTTVITLYCI